MTNSHMAITRMQHVDKTDRVYPKKNMSHYQVMHSAKLTCMGQNITNHVSEQCQYSSTLIVLSTTILQQ